jgi:hypothetical protein
MKDEPAPITRVGMMIVEQDPMGGRNVLIRHAIHKEEQFMVERADIPDLIKALTKAYE